MLLITTIRANLFLDYNDRKNRFSFYM